MDSTANQTENNCTWTVYDLNGNGLGDFAGPLMADMLACDVIATVIRNIPEAEGKNFVVNDESTERLYVMWNGVDGVYDEYIHNEWTDNWKKKE